MMIMHHFFRKLPDWIDEIADPRHPSYIQYSQTDWLYIRLLKNMCGVKTMHAMKEHFNEKTCIETLRQLSGKNSHKRRRDKRGKTSSCLQICTNHKSKRLVRIDNINTLFDSPFRVSLVYSLMPVPPPISFFHKIANIIDRLTHMKIFIYMFPNG